MLFTKNFNRLAVSLFMAIVLLAGANLVMAQNTSGEYRVVLAPVEQNKADVWKDDATGLTWVVKDNGMPITPNEARSYCDSLRTGGITDWRLPTIDEAETIYDSKQAKQYKAKGTITLSEACILTSSITPSGDIWTFCLNSGSKNIGGGGGCGTTALALCVSGKPK